MGNAKQSLVEVRNLKKYFEVQKSFFGRSSTLLKAVDDVSFTISKGKPLGWLESLAVVNQPSEEPC